MAWIYGGSSTTALLQVGTPTATLTPGSPSSGPPAEVGDLLWFHTRGHYRSGSNVVSIAGATKVCQAGPVAWRTSSPTESIILEQWVKIATATDISTGVLVDGTGTGFIAGFSSPSAPIYFATCRRFTGGGDLAVNDFKADALPHEAGAGSHATSLALGNLAGPAPMTTFRWGLGEVLAADFGPGSPPSNPDDLAGITTGNLSGQAFGGVFWAAETAIAPGGAFNVICAANDAVLLTSMSIAANDLPLGWIVGAIGFS